MNFSELLRIEGTQVEMGKGDHVFIQGEHDNALYYIRTGLLKAYYTSNEGKESIKSFLMEDDFIGSLTSVYSGESCSFSLLCLEPASLIKVPFSALFENSKNDQELANAFIDRLLQLSMSKEKREYDFLCLSAEERYSELVKTSPGLLAKTTQNDLSRYLGVTPVGLSRIKKRVNHGKLQKIT